MHAFIMCCITLHAQHGQQGLGPCFSTELGSGLMEMVPAAGGRAAQGSGAHGGQDASTRLLSTLLTEMDGLESATGAAPVICSMQSYWQLKDMQIERSHHLRHHIGTCSGTQDL